MAAPHGPLRFYRAYVAPDGSSRPYARDNVPYRRKNWLRIAAEGARMDILLNFTCGAVSWTRTWAPIFDCPPRLMRGGLLGVLGGFAHHGS
ncbi:S46 family peptidase [Mesorhizobium sp. M0976]